VITTIFAAFPRSNLTNNSSSAWL